MEYQHSIENLVQHFQRGYRINPITECWEWVRGRSIGGYGRFWRGSGLVGSEYAHRFAYYLEHGSIPGDLLVCHKCDNPRCVNPQHLFLGTSKENMLDASEKGRMYGWKRPRGESSGRAKLTQEQVNSIRGDSRTRREIAQEYGVSLSRVSKIKLNQSWMDNPAGRKLTPVKEEYCKESDLTSTQLAKELGVCRQTISRIRGSSTTKGTRNGQAKLSLESVRKIRYGESSPAELSEEFGVSRALISRIRSGKIWKHV